MKSDSNPQRDFVEHLRMKGLSFKEIHKELGVPLSTVSGWLRGMTIPESVRKSSEVRWKMKNVKARQRASERHSVMKLERIAAIHSRVDVEYESVLELLTTKNTTLEIALAFLYLGEGAKGNNGLSLASSSPSILKFYIESLEKLYGIKRETLRYDTHLRFDQDENEVKRFWSMQLSVPIERFRYSVKDKRTIGRPTYGKYHGVCLVSGGGVEIQRRLLYLAEVFSNTITGD